MISYKLIIISQILNIFSIYFSFIYPIHVYFPVLKEEHKEIHGFKLTVTATYYMPDRDTLQYFYANIHGSTVFHPAGKIQEILCVSFPLVAQQRNKLVLLLVCVCVCLKATKKSVLKAAALQGTRGNHFFQHNSKQWEQWRKERRRLFSWFWTETSHNISFFFHF